MKRGLMLTVLLGLLLCAIPALAQDATAGACDQDTLTNAMSGIIADYLQAQGKAEDTAAALQSVTDLRDAADELISGCAEVVAEATPAAESSSTDVSSITEGKYMLNWGRAEQTCPDGSGGTTGTNRPIILHLEGDRVITEDIFIWPKLEFIKDKDGHYFYRRNIIVEDGTTLSFEYTFTSFSPERLEGVSTAFYEDINCALSDGFQLVLLDENIMCMVGSETGANLRSGPGTDFDRLGALKAEEPADVIGQANGSDGFVWWQLADKSWVRSDLVDEAGLCEDVPEVTP